MRELLVRFDIADAENPLEPGKTISLDTFSFDRFANQIVEARLTVGDQRFNAVGRIHQIGVNHFGITWDNLTPA